MATIMEAKVRLFDVYAFLMRQLVNLARFMINSSHCTLDDVETGKMSDSEGYADNRTSYSGED